MLQYTDTPTRVATAITLSQIATRWFGAFISSRISFLAFTSRAFVVLILLLTLAGEMKSIFRDNEAVVKFVAEYGRDAKVALHHHHKT